MIRVYYEKTQIICINMYYIIYINRILCSTWCIQRKKTYVDQNSAPNMLKPMGLLKTFGTIQHYVRYHDNVN